MQDIFLSEGCEKPFRTLDTEFCILLSGESHPSPLEEKVTDGNEIDERHPGLPDSSVSVERREFPSS